MSPAATTSTRAARSRAPLWTALLIGGLGLVLALAWARPLGPSLVEITTPEAGDVVGDEAVDVFLVFPDPDATQPATLRVRVNGADVSDSFTTARNGAYGSLLLLVDGENRLEVGVFGESWWPGRLVEHTVELRFRVERPITRNWG